MSPPVRRRCAEQGVNPGVDLHALTGRAEDRGGLLVAITERRSRADIDRLAEVLGAAVAATDPSIGQRGGGAHERDRRQPPARRPGDRHASHRQRPARGSARSVRFHPLQRERATTIFQKGAPGRRAFSCPELDVPAIDAGALLPERFRRTEPPRLPEVSEPEIVRHYVGISKRNFDLDSGFYPLGSCTMKHNPRLHEPRRAARPRAPAPAAGPRARARARSS